MFQRPTIRGAATAPHGPPLRLAENWEAEAIMTLNTVVLLGSVRADNSLKPSYDALKTAFTP